MVMVYMESDLVAVVARSFTERLNAIQQEGVTIDEAMAGALYAVGFALRQRGAVIDMDLSVRSTLSPLVMGYEEVGKR